MNQPLVNQNINTVSGVIVVGFIYSFKNLKVLRSLSINAVNYMACGQIFNFILFSMLIHLTSLKSLATKCVLFESFETFLIILFCIT